MNDFTGNRGHSFTAMDANDPLTQHYLQMTDEAVQQQNQNAGLSGSALQIVAGPSSEGEATYEGDDELDESESPFDEKPEPSNRLRLGGAPDLDRAELAAESTTHTDGNDTDDDSRQKGAALDFVHVHLEHLPSGEESTALNDTPEQMANNNGGQFYFYRKLATEGSPQNETIDLSTPNSPAISERARLAAKDWELPQKPSGSQYQQQHQQQQQALTPEQQALGLSPDSYRIQQDSSNQHFSSSTVSFQRQQALRGQLQPHNSPQQAINSSRQKALQGHIQMGSNWKPSTNRPGTTKGDDETSSIKDHILQDEDFDFVNMDMTLSAEDSTRYPTNTIRAKLSHCPPAATKHQITTNYTKDMTVACSTSHSQLDDCDSSHGEPGTHSDDPIQLNRSLSNHSPCNDPTDRDQHRLARGGSPDDTSISQTGTFTSEGDYTWRQQQQDRKETLLRKRDEKIRMTLLQTLQHNTRANFCGIFLLGVALATLVLLLVAKWWTTSSNSESMFYDPEEDQNFVITNNDQLLTIEVLAFALIVVLLLGSVCYLGAVTCQSNAALVRAVKHEDACLANSSGRRKHPTYRAPYVEGSPSRRYGNSQDQISTRPAKDDGDHTSQATNTDNYSDFQQNQTFSMLSHESISEQSPGRQDEILISMEEANRYYQDMQEEDPGMCCSPLPYNNAPSIEEPTDYS